jgi:transcription-repair coupling factor (superfamily II helicase)
MRSGRARADLTEPLASQPRSSARPGAAAGAYCSDVHERLVLYKRLANCEQAELTAMQES